MPGRSSEPGLQSPGGMTTQPASVPGNLLQVKILISTGTVEYTLANIVEHTIIEWTSPNDGRPHVVIPSVRLHVTGAMTGGSIGILVTDPAGSGEAGHDSGPVIFGAKAGIGYYHYPDNAISPIQLPPNATVAIQQVAAMTAGSATVLCSLWGC